MYLNISNPDWIEDYQAGVDPLVEKHGGRYLVRSMDFEQLQAGGPKPAGLVVVEFPSLEHAKAFYMDEEYAPHKEARLKGSSSNFLLADGL